MNKEENKQEQETYGAFDTLKLIFKKSEPKPKQQEENNLATFSTTLNCLDPFVRFLVIALFIDYVATQYVDVLIGHSKEMYILNLAYFLYNLALRFIAKSIVIKDNDLYYTHAFGVRKVHDIANYNCLICPFVNSFNMVKIIDKGGNSIILNGVKNVNQLRAMLEKTSSLKSV